MSVSVLKPEDITRAIDHFIANTLRGEDQATESYSNFVQNGSRPLPQRQKYVKELCEELFNDAIGDAVKVSLHELAFTDLAFPDTLTKFKTAAFEVLMQASACLTENLGKANAYTPKRAKDEQAIIYYGNMTTQPGREPEPGFCLHLIANRPAGVTRMAIYGYPAYILSRRPN